MSVMFDEISGGQWLRGRDYVGHKVLFVTKRIETREGTYGTEIVATVDFADLDGEEGLQQGCLISDSHITSKLREGTTVVGKIDRAAPKQKGFQGAIFLAKLEGAEDVFAKQKATQILAGDSELLKKSASEVEEAFKS